MGPLAVDWADFRQLQHPYDRKPLAIDQLISGSMDRSAWLLIALARKLQQLNGKKPLVDDRLNPGS